MKPYALTNKELALREYQSLELLIAIVQIIPYVCNEQYHVIVM